jgi:TRAP-type mannitol/chloroaromatic compound transport system permease small subunit
MAWSIQEASAETCGLPHPFPAVMKSMIPVAAALLMLQGLVMLIESTLTLVGAPTAQDHA